MKLTAKSVESLKPGADRREVGDDLLKGLYLVCQPSGSKSWAVRYRVHGKPRKLTLGSYPALGLAEARMAAREALCAVAEGKDPAGEKKASGAAAEAQADDTLGAHLDRYYARYVRRTLKPSTQRTAIQALDNDLRKMFGHRPIASITRRDLIKMVDRIVDRGAPVHANRVLLFAKRFFGWLVERDVLEASPADRVRLPTAEVSRDRVLSDDELRLLWRATDRIGWPWGGYFRFLLLTGVRRDERGRV